MRSNNEIIREINRNYLALRETGLCEKIAILVELSPEEYEDFLAEVFDNSWVYHQALKQERPDETRYMGHVIRPKFPKKLNKS